MFDGSAEWNSTSLNSCLDPGPNHHASLAPRIQDRTAADTEKMYLPVKLRQEDWDVPFYTEGWVLHSPHEGLPVDAGEVRPHMLPIARHAIGEAPCATPLEHRRAVMELMWSGNWSRG
ncbi:hypothetical protein T01_2839 [Trichinella spiralis]|uniref:Uncharacterized protein n=1 Tax=Trichinella spiralis TaxID=6334 RepID=A0A0V1AS14_TRISP|nr:hypothetical protein T01_2839 [Trichinella spiralis]